MSCIYLTGTDGRERKYSFKEILELNDHEAEVLKTISELEGLIEDMEGYQSDLATAAGALPGWWDRTHVEPIVDKFKDTSRLMTTSAEYLQDAIKNLRLLVKAGQRAHECEVQYGNTYDFRNDCYRIKIPGMSPKWQLHLHYTV